MKEAIKKYFEEQIIKDSALKEVYKENKLDDCIKYITEKTRKKLNGKSGAIEDSIVYKWARDFMLGDIEEEYKSKITPQKKEPAEPTEEVNQTEETTEETETATEEEKKPEEKDFEEVTSGEVQHQHYECGHYRKGGKCLLHNCAIPNSGSKVCDEFSKDVVNRCIDCGYCDKAEKRCLFHKYAIREDLLALACSEFIVEATPKDIEEVKAHPVTEAPKPAKENPEQQLLFDF